MAVVPDLVGSHTGDEGFAVGCDCDTDLSGWTVTDGRRTFAFPPGTHAVRGEPVWATGNLSAWAAAGGGEAMVMSLRLGNSAGSLVLSDPLAHVVDAVAWGNRTVAGWSGRINATAGTVLERDRDPSWIDSDSAQDWRTPRIHHLGETAIPATTFRVHRVTTYASPDSSFEVLTGLIDGAQHRLHLHVYELRSWPLAQRLATAASRGVDVQVLVDAQPTGMGADDRHATTQALLAITAAGGHAYLGTHTRFDDWHQKILVADEAVAVQSENWVPSGVPEDPRWGNRGWGIVLHDAPAAGWFAHWMAADRAAYDVVRFSAEAFDPLYEPPPRMPTRTGEYGPRVPSRTWEGDYDVTALVSPDATQDPRRDPIAALLGSATDRVLAQQLDLQPGAANRLGWQSDDPLVAALAAAAGRGVPVAAQVAAPFSVADAGSQPALDLLAAAGARTSVMARPGIATLHNKGLIVDDAVVVGSMNGNHHSRSQNREVDLVVRGAGIADWFAAVLADDLDPPAAPRAWDVPGQDARALGLCPVPTLFVVALLAARRRR